MVKTCLRHLLPSAFSRAEHESSLLVLVPYVLRVRDEDTPPETGEEHLERLSRTLMLGATEVPLHIPVLGLAEEVVQVANDGQRGVWVGTTAGSAFASTGHRAPFAPREGRPTDEPDEEE
jgi:hypothetical protein